MPALFVFLFKVNIALLLFCAGYYLVLRHLTFYTLNRAYLIVAIIFATLYPKIDLTDFAQKHHNITRPVQTVVLNWRVPAQNLIRPLTQPNYWAWATVVFWGGAVFLGFRLLMQLFSLFQLYRRSRPARIHEHHVRLIDGEAAPFSFWRSIYVNPANHTPADLQAILLHEQVHVNGWHTIDILLAELSCIFYWFNPGIWLMKKAVRENIEFITDRKILNKGFDSKTYQYSLVNVSFNTATPGIVNHFNISTIKKRIIMMNAERSSKFKLTRYAFVVPAVVALLLVFTLTKANVAKPLTHKLALTIKPVTNAIKKAANTATIVLADTVPAKTAKATGYKADTLKTKHPFSITFNRDTNKHDILFLNTNKHHSLDSLNIVLDGKKVTASEFNKVDPADIRSINVVTAADAKRLTGKEYKFDNKELVAFIITQNSAEGKILAQKLSENNAATKILFNGAGDNMKAVRGSSLTFSKGVAGLKGGPDNVAFIARGGTTALSGVNFNEVQSDSGVVRIIKGQPVISIDRVEFKRGNAAVLKNNGDNVYLKEYKFAEPSGVVSVRSLNADGSVNRISDKLIVIDGKVASEKELKKLSAFDIDRMSTSNSTDTVKKYGEKAKYGVVYIYTKKGK